MPRVWLIGMAVFVVALAVAGLIVALVTSRGAATLPADSPEGAVQRYLLALEDEDYREAYAYLSASSQRACSFEDFLQNASYRDVRGSRMTLEDIRRLDGTAIVTAEVTVFDLDVPFDPYEYTYRETFNLRLEEGQWRLVSPAYWCPPFR